MRYCNGFYLFQLEQDIPDVVESMEICHRWEYVKTVGDFRCYSFSYYVTNQMLIDFDEAAIWINESKNLIIVFTQNEELLDYVFQSMRMKLHINTSPYELGIHSLLLRDGKSVMTGMYKQRFSNKVTTSVIRSDHERIQVIEILLNGDAIGRHDRNIESSTCWN
ncbi:hypothetical protein [Bacillus sp. NEB1478]|uniref:hypothetical protein n=1 Tax=Bacillus sp. NEB1478 TaxID=3073816 RepID=UPI00287313F1|nr:hypothetical protein [Bacillus sp. NEB1478]WNB93423.1 hypothetical protein RGB74_07065 [Bacillus sp. NEB1478]